jgi:hypothetical protein
MVELPVWEICERVAEVQTLLHDHIECRKNQAEDPNCSGPCSTLVTSRRTRRPRVDRSSDASKATACKLSLSRSCHDCIWEWDNAPGHHSHRWNGLIF